MARRGRKPKFHFDILEYKDSIFSIISICLIIGGFVIFLASLNDLLSLSSFSSNLGQALYRLFGVLACLLGIALIYSGVLFIGTIKWSFINYRIFGGIFGFWISLSGLFGANAGSFGAYLQLKVAQVISYPGAVFLFFSAVVIALLIIFNKALSYYVEYPFFALQKLFGLIGNKNNQNVKADVQDQHLLEDATVEQEAPSTYNISTKFSQANDLTNQESLDFDTSGMEAIDENNGYSNKFEDIELLSLPSSPIGEDEDLSISPTKSKDFSAIETVEDDDSIEVLDGTTLQQSKTPRLPFSNKIWEYPSLDLLSNSPNQAADAGNITERAKSIEDTLQAFGVKVGIADIHPGPAVTQYALSLPVGTKASKITTLSTDLALRIKSPSGSVRIVAPIPGTNLVGIEVPNNTPATISLKSVFGYEKKKKAKSKLTVALGMDVQGNPVLSDITKWPHALVAGSTGSGKSVMLNAIIASLLFRCSPSECQFIMIDPKMVEMVQYNGIPHLLTPVVTDVEQKAVSALAWAVSEMERRYKAFAAAGVRNIEAYNTQAGFQAEPYIVIVIDELADMMMVASADVEKYIARLAQKSRAVGIHLVIATQRPSTDVLTGVIKANVPTRIAFKVASNVDSRVIIDQSGAEALIGRGDMLYVPANDSKATRIQGVWVSDNEINALVQKLKDSGVEPDYKEEITQQKVATNNKVAGSVSSSGEIDETMMDALEVIINERKASSSYLQRRLRLGYSKAAGIIDELEAAGVVGRSNGSKPREVLVSTVEDAVMKMKYQG